jgi:hypothetical protein
MTTINPAVIYKDPNVSSEYSLGNIWLIKNPSLRNVRLKVLYKDIYCNERRFRFGIADSPNCETCLGVESVSHQLLDCNNALRLWEVYRQCFGHPIPTLGELVVPSKDVAMEIVKSVILKRLLQIDRSRHVSISELKIEMCHYLRIEAIANEGADTQCKALLNIIRS